ncbi:MAG: pirin family protein [Verrucomicrobiota bacterium]
MIKRRPAESRGLTQTDWLESRHSFSFGGYYDPDYSSFGTLRVINDDHVAAGAGFPTHPHRDMEILTYVLAGAVAHEDSMGNRKTVAAGHLQTMSAGCGITHSEFNPLDDQSTRFIQIWITPREKGLTPSYAEWQPDTRKAISRLALMASADGRDGSVIIHQDADVYLFRPDTDVITFNPNSSRQQWLQVMTGSISLNNQAFHEGDGVAIQNESALRLSGNSESSALFFDMEI